MRLLFKGGTVVTGKGPRRADILVEGEKILDVCRDIPAIGAQVVDVTGMLLFPGFIDPIEDYLRKNSIEDGNRGLLSILTSERTNSITNDDKTLVLAFLES